MERIHGVVQRYAWGDPEFIPTLLGKDPDGAPWAELWLGTHPNGPSTLAGDRPLVEVTGHLPYLLKVLSAAEPLSLQTHPNAEQAVDGYERGLYPDDQPKPELLCALTPFVALCGIRPIDRTLELLDEIGAGDDEVARVLRDEGSGAALSGLCRRTIDPAPVIAACAGSALPEAVWIRRLDAMYPGEPSVAVALLLNLVVLEPGRALRLDAGNVHAYLRGSGIELMGASDNVVRAGLTVKPVDVDELLRVADPTPLDEPVLPAGDQYDLPAAGVALRRLPAGATHTATGHELAVDLAGGTWYLAPGESATVVAETFVVVPLTA